MHLRHKRFHEIESLILTQHMISVCFYGFCIIKQLLMCHFIYHWI